VKSPQTWREAIALLAQHPGDFSLYEGADGKPHRRWRRLTKHYAWYIEVKNEGQQHGGHYGEFEYSTYYNLDGSAEVRGTHTLTWCERRLKHDEHKHRFGAIRIRNLLFPNEIVEVS